MLLVYAVESNPVGSLRVFLIGASNELLCLSLREWTNGGMPLPRDGDFFERVGEDWNDVALPLPFSLCGLVTCERWWIWVRVVDLGSGECECVGRSD
jgi:hypothetical protein